MLLMLLFGYKLDKWFAETITFTSYLFNNLTSSKKNLDGILRKGNIDHD